MYTLQEGSRQGETHTEGGLCLVCSWHTDRVHVFGTERARRRVVEVRMETGSQIMEDFPESSLFFNVSEIGKHQSVWEKGDVLCVML